MGIIAKTVSVALLMAATLCLIDANPVSNEQQECTTEKHRPRFHFSAKRNWINDPNGMVYYDGIYHLYFQHHPYSMVWGTMHWGHATSRDMTVWEEQPIALYPDELGTIFSGSSIVDFMNTTGFKEPNGLDPIVAIFTQDGNGQRQSIAYSLDNGFTFTKYEGNPVLNSSETYDFRDPKVSYRNDRWVMTLAVQNRVEFYSSPDLKNWIKESEIGRDPPVGEHGGVWECPDLLTFDVLNESNQTTKLSVLFVSVNPGGPNKGSATQYFIGNFTADARGNVAFHNYPWSSTNWVDWGPDNYAGVTFSNEPLGRQIYMAWMINLGYGGDTPNVSHRGQMTLPRQLGIRVLNHATADYRLTSNPIPELESLRDPLQYHVQKGPLNVEGDNMIKLTDITKFDNPLLELELDLSMQGNPEYYICAHNDLEEEVCFGFNSTHWVLDRSRSGNTDFHDHFRNTLHSFAVRVVDDNVSNIRIFLDVSSIEIFADGGLTTMTAVHYPTEPFNQFYIRLAQTSKKSSILTVEEIKVYGLKCWFNENA